MPTGLRRETETDTKLEDAEVLVAAGRGVGKRENLALLEEVVRLFPSAAIGASRPICDLKWLPLSRQVGVTGRTVAPRLYLACGISGSQQHLAGIRGAQCIVAINSDPQAAIFSVADYIVVDDLLGFLPQLVKKHHERANARRTWA
ncbi:MAG TPA: electron transfer flavoprotein subunit alpha/FixB family protein [Geobacteraceae bacterium]